MSLAEIEAAAEALGPEEKEAWFRFLGERLREGEKPARGARLVPGPSGMRLLEAAPRGAAHDDRDGPTVARGFSVSVYQDYGFRSAAESRMHAHFMPHVLRFAGDLTPGLPGRG